MGHRHTREQMLAAAADVLADVGLAGLTFRQVAERLGTSDRMVVYYFASKDALVLAALGEHARRLGELMDDALGTRRVAPSTALALLWQALGDGAADTAFGVYVELVGLASSGRAPYPELASTVAGQWVHWLEQRVTGPPADRRDRAAAVLAQLDGLLLLRRAAGPGTARSAARGLGLGA